MKMRVTLDHNCLIALENTEPESADIKQLITLHANGTIELCVTAMSASEKIQGGLTRPDYDDFRQWKDGLGLGDATVLLPLCYFGVSYWGSCRLSGAGACMLETEIQKILFPDIVVNLDAHVAGFPCPERKSETKRWRNAKCDVQAFWSHASSGGNIFVTSDRNFHKITKKADLIAIAGGAIATPKESLTIIATQQLLPPPSMNLPDLITKGTPDIDFAKIPSAFKSYHAAAAKTAATQ